MSHSITDDQIKALREEADLYLDAEQVAVCDVALTGAGEEREAARLACAKVIADAKAREEEDRYYVNLCGTCNGSGEGRADGSTCFACGGSGEVADHEAKLEREAARADYDREQRKDSATDGWIDPDLPF